MDTKDLARMSPQDGVAALRSLPRRLRAALRPIDDPDVEERAERVPAGDWSRTAAVAGGTAEVTALDVLREAVRTGVTDLRAAERDFDEVRRA